MPAPTLDARDLEARLAPIGAVGVRPLAGGASSLTYAARVEGRKVVIKVAPPGLPAVLNRDVLRQARLVRCLARSAVPVPHIVWEDAGDPPQTPPLFVMSWVDGVSLEPLFDGDGDEPAVVVAERMRAAAITLARLHAVDPDAVGLAGEPRLTTASEIDRWSALLDTVDPGLAPGWQVVAARLHATLPDPVEPGIVHGDFRLGNLLAVGSEITAVIDWEIWAVGDPRVDLGWFLANADPQTYRRATRYSGALPSTRELEGIYAAAAGWGSAVPGAAWFQALACFKSTATWSLIVKHNRRRAQPAPDVESIAATLPHLLDLATRLLE